MPSITSDMVKAIRTNFPPLMVFAALFAALPLVLPSDSSNSGLNFVVTTLIIYYLHRQVLFDLPMSLLGKAKAPEGTDMPKDSIGRFILVSLLFTALSVLPGLYAGYRWAMFTEGRLDRAQFIGMTMIVTVALLWLLLSAIGTALPAAASKLPFSLSRAWQAGRKTGLRVALQLVLFPGLTFVAVFGGAILLNRIMGQGPDSAIVSFGLEVIFGALFLIPSVMTVVILVRAFRDAYPGD